MGARSLELPLNALAQLVTLSDFGDVRQAADALDCTPQALSRSVSELERATGRQLLVSQGDTRVLGPVGERVADAARAALAAVTRFHAAADEDRSTLRVAHIANADTLAVLLDQSTLSPWTRVNEHVVSDHQQLGQLRACRLDVAVCTTTAAIPDDLEAAPLRQDPLVAFAAIEGSRPMTAAVAPLYGHAWRAHDELVDAYTRRFGCHVERVPVPLGSGRERAALLRAARGRHVVATASAATSSGSVSAAVPEGLSLQWRLVWRRDDTSPLVHEFVAAARDLARRYEWLDDSVAASDWFCAPTLSTL